MSIVVLIGPSGSGKDTIGYGLADNGVPQIVSFTTREKRDGEVHGEDYYFIDESDLQSLDIVEHTEYSGNRYGLLRDVVDKSLRDNKHTYFIANVDGARQIQNMYPEETIPMWLKTDIKTMRSRMHLRGDTEENIQRRLSHAVYNDELSEPDIKGLIVLDANKKPDRLVKEVMYILKRRG